MLFFLCLSSCPLWIVCAWQWCARQGLRFFLIRNPATSFTSFATLLVLINAAHSFLSSRLWYRILQVFASTRDLRPRNPATNCFNAPRLTTFTAFANNGKVASSSSSSFRTCVKARWWQEYRLAGTGLIARLIWSVGARFYLADKHGFICAKQNIS